jgi:hypothetical protein
MKSLIMLTIAGVVMSFWCPVGHADRLYTWEDDNGVTHISKEPPPQKTKLIDIMDYTSHPEEPKQVTGKQVSDEGKSSQPNRIGARESGKASGAIGRAEEIDEDVYYDSDGGRYTRRALRHEIKEKHEDGEEIHHPTIKRHRRHSGRRR